MRPQLHRPVPEAGTYVKMRKNLLKSNKFWIAVLGVILIVSVAAMILLRQGPANRANIYLDGELVETLDLSPVAEPYSITIESEAGTNTITVENGRICVSSADCPDGSCIRQGWISGGATPIVCLPHRLIIELENATPPAVDAVAG